MFNIGICYLASEDKIYILEETRRWVDVFISLGFNVFYHIFKPEEELTAKKVGSVCKDFILSYNIHLLLVEDIFASYDTFSFAEGILHAINDTKTKTIAHHHNLWWNKQTLPQRLNKLKNFPPVSDFIYHVVLNTIDQEALFKKRGIRAFIVPYVYDFKVNLKKKDRENKEFVIFCPNISGIDIGLAKEIVKSFQRKEILESLKVKDVKILFSPSGKHLNESDLILYPALWVGWGPYILEAVAKRVMIAISNYKVYKRDISPFGFDFITLEDQETALKNIISVFKDENKRNKMLEKNIEIGKRCFSLSILSLYIRRILKDMGIKC